MEVKKYIKNPVEIEAILVEKIWFPNIAIWCGGNVSQYYLKDELVDCIEVKTLEGTMVAREGDYIVKGVQGEFYPVKDEIFRYTYSLVGE